MDFVGIFLSAMLVAATPILLAALGELVTEKAGVINLGIEGLMLIGAVAGFATASTTGISLLGVFFCSNSIWNKLNFSDPYFLKPPMQP